MTEGRKGCADAVLGIEGRFCVYCQGAKNALNKKAKRGAKQLDQEKRGL